jgi:cytochrome P450
MVVPANSTVAAPIALFHGDASDLTNPEEFDGFRYSRMNAENAGPSKHQMVSTDLNYLLFGHGKHAWYV